jgi:hypothetical protein
MKLLLAWKNPQVDNPTACHQGLGVTAGNAAQVLSDAGIDVTPRPVADGYYLRDNLRAGTWGAITDVVMCAPFFDSPFLGQLLGEFPHVRFVIVFHSNAGFLGVDKWSTQVLGEQIALQARYNNFVIAANCAKFANTVEQAFRAPCLLLPNLYFLHGPIQRQRALWTPAAGPLRIGAFGATRVMKNLPTAAWAAQILAQKLGAPVEFHISEGRSEGSGSGAVVDGIKALYSHQAAPVTLVEQQWSGWHSFRQDVVRPMHIMFQPSFTESFNGVTADGIAEGVASVVGEAIDWVPPNWIANADDAGDIARIALALLKDRNAASDGYKALAAHNRDALAAWRKYLAG